MTRRIPVKHFEKKSKNLNQKKSTILQNNKNQSIMTRLQMLNTLTIFFLIMGMLITTVVGDDVVLLSFVFLSFFASYVCHDEKNKEWKQIIDEATTDRPE